MKIKDVIQEDKRRDPPPTGNQKAKIVYSAKEAEQQFNDADKGTDARIGADEAEDRLNRVSDMYGVEFVDDFEDFASGEGRSGKTDKETSLLTKSPRKKND